MDNPRISLNNRSHLVALLTDKVYDEHLKIYDLTNTFEGGELTKALSVMSEKQYYYFLYLLANRRWFKIKKLLDQFLKHNNK